MNVKANFVLQAWGMLTLRQRFGAAGCLVIFICSSVLELAALSSSMPFVLTLMDRTYITRSAPLRYFAAVLGDPAPDLLLMWLGAGVALLIVAGTVVNLLSLTLIEWYGVRITAYLADRMVRRTLAAPYEWFLDKEAPILAQRFLADPGSIGLALFPPLMEIVYSGLFLLLAFITIVATLPLITVAVLVSLVVVAVGVLLGFHSSTLRHSETQRDQQMQSNKLGVEAVGGIKDIKIKGREHYFSRAHNRTIIDASIARLKLNVINRLVPALVNLVGQLGLLMVALTLFFQGSSAAELASQLTLLVLVLGRTLPAATRFSGAVNKMLSAKPSVHALASLEAELDGFKKHARDSNLPDIPADWKEVRFASVSFKYKNADRLALNDVSLAFERNKFYGIVGPSGAGKSTLVDLLLGLFEPTSGQVLIDGKPLNGFSQHSWFHKIGYVPQTPFISNDTIRRNVAFGVADGNINDEQVWQSLELAGLADVCRNLPGRLETAMGDRGIRLSGGQRQRLAIARAFYDKPRLLVLDEATSALDVLTEREIQETIGRLVGQTTVVAIAHRLSTIEMSDSLFLFDDGRLVGQGTYRSLLAQSPLFGLLANQFVQAGSMAGPEAANQAVVA